MARADDPVPVCKVIDEFGKEVLVESACQAELAAMLTTVLSLRMIFKQLATSTVMNVIKRFVGTTLLEMQVRAIRYFQS